MKLNKYFYLFLTDRFNGNQINLNNLYLNFELNTSTNNIDYVVENPNDVSYTSYAIKNLIDDELHNFSKITDNELYKKLYKKQNIIIPNKIYINDKDYDKFLNLAQSVETYNYGDIKANMYVFDMEFDCDGDVFSVNLDIKLLYPTDPDTRDKLTYSQVQERLIGLNEDDRFVEYIDRIYTRLLDELWYNPNLFDNGTMAISCYPKFYTDKGQKMKHW